MIRSICFHVIQGDTGTSFMRISRYRHGVGQPASSLTPLTSVLNSCPVISASFCSFLCFSVRCLSFSVLRLCFDQSQSVLVCFSFFPLLVCVSVALLSLVLHFCVPSVNGFPCMFLFCRYCCVSVSLLLSAGLPVIGSRILSVRVVQTPAMVVTKTKPRTGARESKSSLHVAL